MRRIVVLAALALAACGSNAPVANDSVTEETEAAGVTAVNDATAIDAATGAAANMAADVDFTLNEEAANESDNKSSARTPARSAPRSSTETAAPEPDEPVANNTAG